MTKVPLHTRPAGTFTRLAKQPADEVVRYTHARVWPLHKALFPGDILVNLAWVTMLSEEGVIPANDAAQIIQALRHIETEGPDDFPFDPKSGDFYFNLQARVIDRIGPVGGHIYTGRSRADGESSALRVYLRDRLLDVGEALVGLAAACMEQSSTHTETVMPGFTGSQPAQPWTFGHYLLSFVDAYARDFSRIQDAYGRTNLGLLGVGVGAGSDLPLNRTRAAELLGFDGFVENSREWVTSYDAVGEVVGVWSILFAHLGQMASDLHLWCTQQFDLIELGDEFSGSSSFMPQKRNPTPLHLIRALASTSLGYMPAVLGLVKTSSQDFDTMLINLPTITLAGQVHDCVNYLAAAIPTIRPHADSMRRQAIEMWTTASEIPTLIVRHNGLDWRSAHWITERLVRNAADSSVAPGEITGQMLDDAAQQVIGRTLGISDNDLLKTIDPMRFVQSRQTRGSVNPEETKRMLASRRELWGQHEQWVGERRSQLAQARRRLDEAVPQASI